MRLTTAKSEDSTVLIEKLRSSTAISAVPQEAWQTPAKSLFYKLSATHLIYLSNFNDELKRAFYEQETIRGCWTVTELDRQVSSQYYERMGLSKDKKALQKLAMKNAQQLAPRDILHNPVTLEFLDLKIDRFRHEYASQLNLYMNYYKHEVMQEGDNPPIGLLLCTDYGETTVQYATEGLSQNLFVSKYRLQLPSEDEIRKYLLDSISEKEFMELKNAE